MANYLDRCIFLATSGGTGSFAVATSAPGFLTPAQAKAVDGQSYSYAAETRNASGVITAWETGSGYYLAAAATLSRTPVFSSNTNALVNFGAAPQVMMSARSADLTTGVVSVKEFGADGRDRLYTNIIGGSGYTGGSASNLVTHPEDATLWTQVNVTVIADAVTDPRGNLLADSITETVTNNEHVVADSSFTSGFTLGSTIRYDVEIKPGLRTWFMINIDGGGSTGLAASFNLIGSGVVGGNLQFAGALFTNPPSVVALPNGWYRCTVEGTIGAATSVRPIVKALLGDLIYWNNAGDPHQFYAGSTSAVAFYLGLSRIYAIATYLGAVFIAGDNIYSGVALTGGTGTGARANIVVGLGQVLTVTSYCPGAGYVVGDTLSCSAADIGGSGSGFTCQVQTLGNDSVAIQAALDAGNGAPITVYLPAGTYNVFPQDALGSHCLMLRHNNVRIVGAGRNETTIQFFVSGGRHPETSYDVPSFGGNAGFVWRGCGFQLKQNMQNLEWRSLRLTGLCRRHNYRWPLGGPDPSVISGGNPLGIFGDGDGWDESHLCIARFNRAACIDRGMRIIDCELDSWKGEIVGSIGDFVTPPDDTTQWTWWIENNYIHDTHADCISSSGNVMILNNELGWGSNGVEEGTAICHTVFRHNHFHDHTHGITLVVGTDTGASTTSTGQQVISDNFFERCYLNGIFVYQFQCNVLIDSNVFVDCGVTGSIAGGAVNVSLLSGSQPYANVFVRQNLIYNHARNVLCPLGLGMGLFTGGALQGVYIEDNRAAATPAAQAAGYLPQAPWSINTASGTTMELINNDMRISTGHEQTAFTGTDLENNNLYGGENLTYNEVHKIFSQFDKINNTFADIPGFIEHMNDSSGVWFEAVLFIAATVAGAKIAVATSTGSYLARYDVEMWAGTTVDAASGQSTTMGASFASAASITKIKITGFFSVNYGNAGSTIKLQFAQNTTNATASSVLFGSWFKVRNAY